MTNRTYSEMEKKLKHLELIQDVVNRQSTNSFLLKGWSVIIIAALIALAAKDAETRLVVLAGLPALVFWGLDGFFIRQEKLFRKLYDRVRLLDEEDVDFGMSTKPVESQVRCWLSCVFSRTLVPFHGALVVAIVAAYFFSGRNC